MAPRSSVRNASSMRAGLSVEMVRACAHAPTGDGEMICARPTGASGPVMMSAGVMPRYSSASSMPTAILPVPKKMRLFIVGFGVFVVELGGFVYIKDAFEMIHFVLKYVCQKS